jgi:hypothetical protein
MMAHPADSKGQDSSQPEPRQWHVAKTFDLDGFYEWLKMKKKVRSQEALIIKIILRKRQNCAYDDLVEMLDPDLHNTFVEDVIGVQRRPRFYCEPEPDSAPDV